jgi:AcrR family transcriptional regulator
MNSEEKVQTKEKIIAVASELFSRFGYVGTSIRDIASQSGVNVASINYHFGSKGNLYWATVDEKHKWLDQGIQEICEHADDIGDVIVKAYHYLMQDTTAIRTAMKMMLTDGVPEPEGDLATVIIENLGPPGAQHLVRVLRKSVAAAVTDQAVHFGMKCLFGSLIHWATMSASCKVEAMKASIPELQGEEIPLILKHHTAAIGEYINAHPDINIAPSK